MPTGDPFDETTQALSANVTRLRERLGWTQARAADAMGIDVKHLQKLEYGQLNPSLRTLVGVSKALGVSVGRLLSPTAQRKPRPVGRPRGKASEAPALGVHPGRRKLPR